MNGDPEVETLLGFVYFSQKKEILGVTAGGCRVGLDIYDPYWS